MTHLIVGLGNIGAEYADTRHNIGFKVLDALAKASNLVFEDKRYGFVTEMRVKNKQLLLLKPSTYMNLSGNAVRYWMTQKKIDVANVLIIVDDLALPFGEIRIKPGGSEAGHNGLRSITQCLGTQQYPRLRFGIGNNFPKGGQVDFVLGKFSDTDLLTMDERIAQACEAIKAFALSGINFAMNHYNGSGKKV
ncbi:MAG: aminoacyl-tRNA hydrolase [Alloprevotella sp.]|nr:aminoacyl-tRNA hydrolase [Bacteroidales bacterium]MDY3944245.1 aminoacyl-tRNA hydrolase [Alloprevotella sp.]